MYPGHQAILVTTLDWIILKQDRGADLVLIDLARFVQAES